MRDEVDWITDALSAKNIAREMTHYRVESGEIRATDGRLTAGHPFDHPGPFLVPGSEFEKLVRRMPDDCTLTVKEDSIVLRSGRSSGNIKTLPVEQWSYPGIDEDGWQDAPEGLIDVLKKIRPFVSDNATQAWALGVALQYGYAYATNNIAIAGARIDSVGDINCILPVWAVDFIVDRSEGLESWQWTANYVAFRWANGAWMRAQLIDSTFPANASEAVRKMENYLPPQAISDEFRKAFTKAIELCSDAVHVSNTHIGGTFGAANFQDGVEVETLEENVHTIWGARYLKPVIAESTHWEPMSWPGRTAFRGKHLFGFIMGRRE